MYIKDIELENFRNYKKIKLQFHEKVNIFLGNNAQGKTNLLEAIYITSLGKSFRTAKDNEMIAFGEDFCRVKVAAVKDYEDVSVEIAIMEKGKGIKIDGVKAKKNSELLEKVYIVAFTPEDLKIVKDEPEKRRRFMDRELCLLKPSYYDALGNYKKLLVQRNILIKENDINHDVLEIWDDKLAEYGSILIQQRLRFVEKINIISGHIHNSITNSGETLETLYEPSIACGENIEDQTNIFKDVLKKNLKNDIYRKNTSKGPHKDDLKLCVNGIDIRRFGSQGQQRTAALSLKLAELKLIKEETDENAILLLDDVLSELDAERQKFLINSLGDIQIFITTAEMSLKLADSLPCGKRFWIEKGIVKS